MTDRAPFEARLADAFERYAAAAPVTVNGRAVAAIVAAQRPRRPTWSSARLLALAALLLMALVAAAVAGTGGHLLDRLSSITSPPFASNAVPTVPIASIPGATPTPTLATGAPAWEAIYLRNDPADATVIHVVAVRPDGTERLLRTVDATTHLATGTLVPTGQVARTGLLFLYEDGVETGASGEIAILDLADPTTPASFVSFRAPVGPRWSSSGLLAIPGYGSTPKPNYEQWSAITILPRAGVTTALGSLQLFGGGPSIVWTADGSGILDGSSIKPVDGGVDRAIRSDDLFLDRWVGMGRRTAEICRPATDGVCTGAAGATIQVRAVGGAVTPWYVAADPNDQPTDVTFAKDGQAILAMFERVDGARHTAVIRRLDSPNRLVDIATFDLPPGAFEPGFEQVDPADTSFAIYYWTGDRSNPSTGRGTILQADGSAALTPSGSFAGWVPGSLAESWPSVSSTASPAPAP